MSPSGPSKTIIPIKYKSNQVSFTKQSLLNQRSTSGTVFERRYLTAACMMCRCHGNCYWGGFYVLTTEVTPSPKSPPLSESVTFVRTLVHCQDCPLVCYLLKFTSKEQQSSLLLHNAQVCQSFKIFLAMRKICFIVQEYLIQSNFTTWHVLKVKCKKITF